MSPWTFIWIEYFKVFLEKNFEIYLRDAINDSKRVSRSQKYSKFMENPEKCFNLLTENKWPVDGVCIKTADVQASPSYCVEQMWIVFFFTIFSRYIRLNLCISMHLNQQPYIQQKRKMFVKQ